MEKINGQRVFNFYNRKNKWLGIIDYKTLVFGMIYIILVLKLVFSLSISYKIKIYISSNLIIPLIIFVILNVNEESILDKLCIIIKFLISRKIYYNGNFFNKEKTIYAKDVKK